MLHGFDRLGESDAIRQLEPREEEAVARAPLAQQDRETQSHGLGTGPAAQPALEWAIRSDPFHHRIGGRRFGLLFEQRERRPQQAPALGRRHFAVTERLGQLGVDLTQRGLRIPWRVIEQGAAQRRAPGDIEPLPHLGRALPDRRESRIESREDGVGLDPGGMRDLEQRQLLVLAREIGHAQSLVPEREQDVRPAQRAVRRPARHIESRARPIDHVAFGVGQRPLEVAAEALRQRGLRLRMLTQELAQRGEIGLHRLARLERRQRRILGLLRAFGRDAIDLLERPRMVDARILLRRGFQLAKRARPFVRRHEAVPDREELELLRVRLSIQGMQCAHQETAGIFFPELFQAGRIGEAQQSQIVLAERRERAAGGGIGHAMARRAREVDDHVLAVVLGHATGAEGAVQHGSARGQRRHRIEALERRNERLQAIAEAGDREHLRHVGQTRPRALPDRFDQRLPEGLGAAFAGAAHHFAQRLLDLPRVTARRQRGERHFEQLPGFLGGALRHHLGQHADHGHQALGILVLDEFQRRLLEPGVTTFGRESRRQLPEQGAALLRVSAFAEPHRQQEAELEIVGQEAPRPLQRLDAGRLLAQGFVRLDQEPCARRGLFQLERSLGHGGERLPFLGGDQSITEREQRLERALALAMEQAGAGEEVLDRGRSSGLAQARRALVAQEHHQAFGLRRGRERVELGSGFRVELGCRFSAQDGRQLVAYGHEGPGGTKDGSRKGTHDAGKWRGSQGEHVS